MKKVMTALAVAATALLAFGEVPSLPTGTSFEGLPYGARAINALEGHNDTTGETGGDYYWQSDAADKNEEALCVTNDVAGSGVSRPDYYADPESPNTKSLHIDVSSRLYRTVKPYNNNGGEPGTAIGDGLYLDTLVKFTAADQVFGDDALSDGDKIAIEYAATDDGITNFVVRAGVVGLDAANYLVNAPANFDVNAWHRLTVRTITDIAGTLPGFKIYIDEVPLAYATDADGFATTAGIEDSTHTIFPSAVKTDEVNYNTISAVAFTGNGSLDDVVFTSTTPNFIKASEAVVATFTADAGVTGISVQVGKGDPIVVDMTADTLAASLPPGTTEFTVTATIDSANGYSLASLNGGNSNPATVSDYAGDTIAISTTRNNFTLFDENGDAISGTFETLAQAMAATGVAKIQLAYDYTETTIPDEGPVYTIVDGKTLVLDLNGKTLNGGTGDENELFYVKGALTVIDSGNGGKIVYGGEYGIFAVEGELAIGSADDNGPFIDGKLFADGSGDIIRANVKVDGNTTDNKLTWTVAPGSACSATAVGGYWVVAPAAQPAPTSVTAPTAATGLVYNGSAQTGVAAGEGYTLTGTAAATDAGNYSATAKLEDGYIWSDDTTEDKVINWSIAAKTDAEVVVTLTSQIAEYTAQLAFPTASATIGNGVVAGTSAWNPATITEPNAGETNTYTVTFTVTTANYAGSTGTAEFKVWKAAAPAPSGLDPANNTPVEVKAADADAAKAAVELVTPTGVDAAEYKALFDFTATEKSEGVYDVSIAGIKEKVEADVEESAMAVLAEEKDAKVQVPAGLYYKVTTYTALGGEAAMTAKGQSNGAGVSVAKPGTTQGFIKIEMAPTEIK